MIYLKLFLSFIQIGAFSFGGGYGMISIIRETVLSNNWLTESEFLNFIAVAESTPGPIAVNIATFVGSSQGGLLGAVVATLGVVLPSFIIILLIASVLRNLLKYKAVDAFLTGVRPCVVALILAMSVIMALSTFLGIESVESIPCIDVRAIILFVLVVFGFVLKYFFDKKPSPVLLIVISAGLGMALYSL